MTRLVLIAMLTFWVAGAAPAAAQRQACPPYSSPIKLNFNTASASTSYNNALNVTGIQSLIRRGGQVIAGRHQRPLGLTSSQLGFSISGRTTAVAAPSGYCVYLTAVDVEFGYRTMDVYIASEFGAGSCEYKTILDHENQHVAINRNTLREFAPRVRQALEIELGKLKPRLTLDAQATTDRKLTSLQEALDPLLDEMDRVLASRNAVIDSDNNYAALADLCRNWDRGNVWPVQPPAKSQ